MQAQKTPFIIFSVCQGKEQDVLNTLAVQALLDTLNIKYKLVDGVYEGTSEDSFIVSADYVDIIQNLCKEYNQNCYLFSDNQGHCTLHKSSGEQIAVLGVYKVFYSKPAADYTYLGNGQYMAFSGVSAYA